MAIRSAAGVVVGIDAVPVEVEVDLLRRLPAVCIVGLAASAVKESGERIRSAVEAIGLEFPRKRIVVNLAPADLRKEGTGLDLPIALGILAADEHVPAAALARVLAVGELALSGELRPVRGVLALALLARSRGLTLVVPAASAPTAALVPGVEVVGARTLGEVVSWLRGERTLEPLAPNTAVAAPSGVDLADVRGQEVARRALEITAAGAHHLLMLGPPGCGKSMLARRLPTILPPMDFAEALEVSRVHDAAGLLGPEALLAERPFRAPHHSVTTAGMVGDQTLRPGEVSLAHHGVLFLDEAPEFGRATLEVLRQPLEDGTLVLSRARGTLTLPAAVSLVMAANTCRCSARNGCRCPPGEKARYLARLSGPILDRIDLAVELAPVPSQTLVHAPPGESSARVRERVAEARRLQRRRGQTVANGRLGPQELERWAAPSADAREVLVHGVEAHGLSGRGLARVLRVARTVADLDGVERISEQHVAEAFVYRPPPGL
jgi:magnesium chelatase family protein